MTSGKYEKSSKYFTKMLRQLRGAHMGMPIYLHLLQLQSTNLIKLEDFEEAEMMKKNIIEFSKDESLYPIDIRVTTKVEMLLLYLNHRPELSCAYAKELLRDPDL